MDKTHFYNYLEKLYYFTKNKRMKASEKLLPYIEFKYELGKIELMEEKYNIDTGINKDSVLFSLLNQCIAEEIHEINVAFMEFYSNINSYADMLDKYKSELDNISCLICKKIVKDKDYIYMLDGIMKTLSKITNITENGDKNK